MLPYVLSGATFGLAAGLSPGPILALVVSQTLRYGVREGFKVSLAPLLTDLPIVTLCVLGLSRVADLGAALAWISLAGGAYVAWLGVQSLRTQGVDNASAPAPRSVRKAMAINFLNAHVYLFWLTVGAPMVLKAAEGGAHFAAGFIAPFYVCLCGSKMALAALVNRSRGFLKGRTYVWTLRALGAALIAFGLWLIAEGARALSASCGAAS
ncbi:MAG: LysE family translocator [Bryobacteraceae bacterium]|nr:LysE family translocator [Bryobacteraceae bacterium]